MKVIHMYAALPESLRQHVRGIIEALSTSQGDRDEQEAAERGRGSYPEVTAATGQADGRIVCRNGHAKGSQGVSSQGGCGDGQGEENARTDAFEAKAKSQIASEILAANVQTLIDRVGSGSELARLTGVAQKTISRIANGENAVTLDTLNDLAKGARLQPWQLLSPGLNLSNPPLLFQRDAPSPARREA
jgi:transcriptional regulator with XRE-family HTH domain